MDEHNEDLIGHMPQRSFVINLFSYATLSCSSQTKFLLLLEITI